MEFNVLLLKLYVLCKTTCTIFKIQYDHQISNNNYIQFFTVKISMNSAYGIFSLTNFSLSLVYQHLQQFSL